MRTNQYRKSYNLSPAQEEQRRVLEIVAHPGRYALLVELLDREDALTAREIAQHFGLNDDTLHHTILKPLAEHNILASSRGGAAGYSAAYYISPEASEFVQRLLALLG